MGISYNPSIVTEGLVLALDPQSTRSYVGSGTTWTDLTNNGNSGTLTNGPVFIPGGPFNNSGGSVQFDGTGDYLSLSENTDFDFSGDFTIESWFYVLSKSAAESLISKGPASHIGTKFWTLEFNSSGELSFFVGASAGASSTPVVKTSTVIDLNTWYHISISRFNGTTRIFVNGIEENSAYDTYTVAAGGDLYIGAGWYSPSGREIEGHISNLRILKGTALYTANFTPPTGPLEAIDDTVLLTCQGGAITDNGPSSHAITITGDVEAITASAFEFDGTNDYAEISSNADFLFGTEEFAMEWWEYFTGGGGYIGHIGVFQSSSPTTPMIWTVSGSFHGYLAGSGWTSVAMSPLSNQWAHYVVTGVTGNIRFYQNGELKDTTTWNWSSTSSAANFSIACGWSQSWQMPGKISAVRVYKGKSFTEDEVKRNFSALRGRYGI